ncbi:MAG: YlxR family protein [Anaerolineales bacterium]|nr:YlxR family protein [Anaerolineales bacterium]
MSPKQTAHVKHIPLRMCVGCRQALAKRSLIRVVRGPDGIRIDPGGKAAGRGAYVHDRRECWEKALQGALSQALKAELSPAEREALKDRMLRLPPDADGESDPPPAAGGSS